MKKNILILITLIIVWGCQTSSLFQSGESEFQKQNYALSREIFLEYIKTNPASNNIDEAYLNIGASYYFENMFSQAEEYIVHAYKNSAKDNVKEYSLYLLSWAAYKNGEYAQAVYYYDRFIRNFPFSRLRLSLANEIEPLKMRSAEYASQTVRRLDASEYLTAANAFKRAGNFNAAIPNYEKALQIMPEHTKSDIMIELAECYENIRDYASAERIYEQIINLKDKNYYKAIYNITVIYEIKNQNEQALTNYKFLLLDDKNPYYESALYKMYEYYETRKMQDELIVISRQIIDFDVYSLMAEEAFNVLMTSPLVPNNRKNYYASEYMQFYPGGKYESAAKKIRGSN